MRTRALTGLHAFMALNAIGGGIYGVTGAQGVPVDWLQHTPFGSYFVPSLILLVVVGGTQAVGSYLVARQAPQSRTASLAAGVILLGWIGVQLAMLGYVSWLQPAVLLAALANLALAWGLPRHGRAAA